MLAIALALACLRAASSVGDLTTPSCAANGEGGNCFSGQQNETILLQHVHNSTRLWTDQGPSCVDGKTPITDVIPQGFHPEYVPDGVQQECKYEQRWEMSEWLLGKLSEAGTDPKQYKFRICYNLAADPEVRRFPWVHATADKDWLGHMLSRGSVMLFTQNSNRDWRVGYQQVLPDALEFFASKGEILGRKIIPKFFLYGWSKGCTFNFPLSRWRPDVVQGLVCIHGCNGKQMLDDEHFKKASPEAAAPVMWMTSKDDGFLHCTKGDTESAYKFTKKNSHSITEEKNDPCGHYPLRCMPLCDPMELMIRPFWDFWEKATAWKQCVEFTNQKDCEASLCDWVDYSGTCHPLHPSWFTNECQEFCKLSAVESLDGLDEAACQGSYVEVDGRLHKGVFSGSCSPGVGLQCPFQDQC